MLYRGIRARIYTWVAHYAHHAQDAQGPEPYEHPEPPEHAGSCMPGWTPTSIIYSHALLPGRNKLLRKNQASKN